MADQDTADYYALCANDKDKIEGLNERLMESSISQSSCDLNSNNNSITVEKAASVSPLLSHYKYHCFSRHDSPVNFSSLPTYLPPIGVFWDIENCHVPKGRSAMAATQAIRDKFFSGYREAEFIVVCDVVRENSRVMKELNNAQVNLIHVARECKNAADEKLKQSIRRFADIHGSPAAVILISGDINFAPDLSDLRYRKKIHVILLHMKNTSEALILCANEHYDFSELMDSLPSTNLQVTAYYDLLVSNLPEDQDIISIKYCLKQMFESCGGQVMEIQPNTAIVRFTSKPFADRAQKRMDGKIFLGSKISVKFQKETENIFQKVRGNSINRNGTVSESEIVTSSPRQMYSAGASLAGGRTLHIPHYQSSSPVIRAYSGWNTHCTSASAPVGMVQLPSLFVGRPYSNNNNNVAFNRTYNELARAQSPLFWQVPGSQQFGHLWEEQYKVEKTKVLSRRIHIPQVRDNGVVNNIASRSSESLRRLRGTHTYVQPPKWTASRQQHPPLNVSTSLNGTAHSQSNFKRRSPSPITRTPSPYENTVQTINQQNNHTSPYHPSDTENEEVEKFFNPINNHNGISTNNETCTPIELQVTNLDQSINPKKMRHMLVSIFMEHVMVLNVSIFIQSDGSFAASVKVPSLSDAQYAISQLHRRKVGYKRILISYAHSGRASPQVVRAQIVMLLQEVPGHKLALFKFREMYESRFMISISVSELYKMKDVCIVTEDPGGRMVSLNPDHRNTPSPCFSNTTQEEQVELPYCTIHTLKPWSDKGWAEQKVASLPNAEFKEKLQVVENGVPLEHLVSCLSCVELKQGIGSIKYLIWAGNKTHENNYEENKCVSSPLANQLALFSRELVDLLKTAPHCQLPFNRLIPAYHHHFGRQCRVANYGFTKLIDLLEALTHTVQVMGEGNSRVVTLSHRAQVRRFTSDLLRVLKSKASKQVALSEFPSVYARVIDYGVCEIEDILSEVSENTVVVTMISGGDKMIAIPKREQTAEEIERTKQFAVEVIELLRHAPQCKMQFNKFVPSYHHHFGHQCRLSDYGFTKLIELFEAIPDIVKIEDDSFGERQISLTEKEGLQLFGCTSIWQLMQKLGDTIVYIANKPVVMMIDKSHLQQLTLECRRLLMDKTQHRMLVKEFQQLYAQYYLKPCNINELKQNLSNVVQFTTVNDEQFIELTSLHCFACNLYCVMMNYGGVLKLSQFEEAYLSTIGSVCNSEDYGFPTIFTLLQALPCTVTIKLSRRKKHIICLNKKITDSSNESCESDSSSHINVSNNSTTLEFAKWTEQTVESQNSWKQTDKNNLWLKESCKSWKTSSSEDHLVNWSLQENGSESFLKSLMQTPIIPHNFPLAPPKPDSPSEEDLDKNQWESSVWMTPPKFTYPQDEHTTNVQVPPLTLPPSWNQITSGDNNLLSPTKNLLTAAANPLNPRTSPFFSSKRNFVVAPHPSELPLPSLSLTPKKKVPLENILGESFTDKQDKIINNSMEDMNFKNNKNDNNNMESNGNKEKHSTPIKQCK
ncbi:Meiosis arrest female protein 1 like protein [Eufriesea mexicana]|uniref:Meiosis regulator and mRNA stability factor 1 n=1 Tax=Eufriesea mexicana TaxID=516756 RepID=A0A310SK27_9HYME|nr:Meiosis arrest female protein 1 like protein [Eufriesea mexicana]